MSFWSPVEGGRDLQICLMQQPEVVQQGGQAGFWVDLKIRSQGLLMIGGERKREVKDDSRASA